MENSRRREQREILGLQRSIDPALETLQFNATKYGVAELVPGTECGIKVLR